MNDKIEQTNPHHSKSIPNTQDQSWNLKNIPNWSAGPKKSNKQINSQHSIFYQNIHDQSWNFKNIPDRYEGLKKFNKQVRCI